MNKLYVDEEKCEGCGLCEKQCGISKNVIVKNGKAEFKKDADSCHDCFHCLKVCPNSAIFCKKNMIDADIYQKDEIDNPVLKRRSCRDYLNKEISRELISKVINEANTAPRFDIDFSERKFIVVDDMEKLDTIRKLVLAQVEKVSKVFKVVARIPFLPVGKRKDYKMIAELFELLLESSKSEDILFHGAPVLVLVAGQRSKTVSPDNCLYAMGQFLVLAEEYELATCVSGFVSFFSKVVGKYLGFPNDYRIYAATVLGYPEDTFSRHFVRKDSSVVWNKF